MRLASGGTKDLENVEVWSYSLFGMKVYPQPKTPNISPISKNQGAC